MLKILKQSFSTGIVTNSFPESVSDPPEGFLGKPVIDFARCTACDACSSACPTSAINVHTSKTDSSIPSNEKHLSISYGDCIFCGECAIACPDSIVMSKEFLLATTSKEALTLRARYVSQPDHDQFAGIVESTPPPATSIDKLGSDLRGKIHSILGRSLHIREVDAGSCNGCEIEITALNNAIYDIERFGAEDKARRQRVDQNPLGCHRGELATDLGEDLIPEGERMLLGVRLGCADEAPARAALGEVVGVTDDAFDADT